MDPMVKKYSLHPSLPAEQIRGLIARRSGDAKQATQRFRNANEAAGRAGIAILALDGGLAFGEALLASGEIDRRKNP